MGYVLPITTGARDCGKILLLDTLGFIWIKFGSNFGNFSQIRRSKILFMPSLFDKISELSQFFDLLSH